MKKSSFQLLLIAFVSGIILTSCNAGALNKQAEATATDFYNDLQKKDFDAALKLCSSKAFTEDGKDVWQKAMKRNSAMLGELKSFTKTSGFNIATSSKGETVTVTYDSQWQYGQSKDSLVLVKENDGSMKVVTYSFDHKDAKYQAALSASEKEAAQYMEDVKEGNYDAATNFCSEEALKVTSKENWAAMLQTAATQSGAISSFNIVKDSSNYNIGGKGDLGEGNYYLVYAQSNRGGNKMMERMVFFQKNYNEPVKLTGHYFL